MTRHRIVAAAVAGSVVLLAAGCMGGGGDGASGDAAPPAATAPTTVATPVAVAPATLGGAVHAGPDTPKDVVAALKGDDVIVVAFLNGKAADDQKVAKAVRDAQADNVVSDGTRFFVYTLGQKRFGDLADLLGVEGTPSVAVIGRDRNLTNLFTGLVDGDILRQAIWDAADTAAKNPGASSKSHANPAKTTATGPSGNAEAIALAKQVNARYATIPGVRITGPITDHDLGKGTATMDGVVRNGVLTEFSYTAKFNSATLTAVGSGSGLFIKPGTSTCWAKAPASADDAQAGIGDEMVKIEGRFAKPVVSGDTTTLSVTRPGKGTEVTVIETKTKRVLSGSSDGERFTLTELETAPAIPEPTPLCGGTVS